MTIIILGAPGSGKGTQADLLCKKFNLFHISGGAALRREIASGSKKGQLLDHIMSKGELVPFETICSVTNPEMLTHKNNFILDGTPRDLAQAEYLTDFFTENKMTFTTLSTSVPDEKLMNVFP
jgi:adenylate kinase